jgi:DNA replication protein DnaC
MSREVVVAELVRGQARLLKMPGLARSFETTARQAREDKWSHEEFLHEVLSAEVTSRAESAVRHRLRDARFPEAKTLDTFDFSSAEGVDAAQVAHLSRCEWIRKAENVVFAGPIGTGKTHLAIALGTEAARQRLHVAFWRAADLVRSLVEARDQRELGRLHRRLTRVDLLIVDEVGFVPFDRAGGELLFNALADRYERKSVLVTSNLAFSEWPKVFAGDEKLTTALLDRLAHHSTVITTKGKSFRMRRRGADKASAANANGEPVSKGAPPLAALAPAQETTKQETQLKKR